MSAGTLQQDAGYVKIKRVRAVVGARRERQQSGAAAQSCREFYLLTGGGGGCRRVRRTVTPQWRQNVRGERLVLQRNNVARGCVALYDWQRG